MREHLSSTTGPQRLGYAGAAGVATLFLPLPLSLQTRGLLAWVVTAAVNLVLSAWLAAHFETDQIRDRAKAQDESAIVLFLVMVIALCASVAAIVGLLGKATGLPHGERTVQMTLSVLALAASWLWIHTLFAFHYAHRYYQQEDAAVRTGRTDEAAFGLVFPGCDDPNYFDFFYHALVVGMTSQVSDVQITSRPMRRIATVHGLLAFAFNVVVVALGINAVAALLQ